MTEDNLILDTNPDEAKEKFQVYINDISWNPKQLSRYQGKQGEQRPYAYGSDLPKSMTFDIPENVLQQASKDKNAFDDVIESFIYNALTRKFMHEVYSCQIWILD